MGIDVCPSGSSRLTIDLDALRSNYRVLAARAAPAALAAVVKADAYGLGAREAVPALAAAGCRVFFVAQLREALALAGVAGDATFYVLNGLDPDCEAVCVNAGFVPVLNTMGQVARWRAHARRAGRALPAALQLDSGMSRLGLDAADAARLAADGDLPREIDLKLIMTHLACADEVGHPANAAQLARFRDGRALFPGVPASIANSGGVLLAGDFRMELARPGIALYGAATGGEAAGIRPVVRLEARVLQIRSIAAGTGVGYGLDYVAPSARRLATIAVGYGDGWPRSLGGIGAAWHDGRRLPIVGRVSMDSLIVDVTDVPDGALAEDDFVELIGPSQTLADVARDAGTIPYEILTRLGPRHQRIYLAASAASLGGAA